MEFAKLSSKMIAKLELVVRTTVIKAAKKGLSIVSILLPFVSLVFKKHEILEKGLEISVGITDSLNLTIKNTAASSVSLHFTSRSIGKVTPKLSASVNASFNSPDHCLDTFPTLSPSFVKT